MHVYIKKLREGKKDYHSVGTNLHKQRETLSNETVLKTCLSNILLENFVLVILAVLTSYSQAFDINFE